VGDAAPTCGGSVRRRTHGRAARSSNDPRSDRMRMRVLRESKLRLIIPKLSNLWKMLISPNLLGGRSGLSLRGTVPTRRPRAGPEARRPAISHRAVDLGDPAMPPLSHCPPFAPAEEHSGGMRRTDEDAEQARNAKGSEYLDEKPSCHAYLRYVAFQNSNLYAGTLNHYGHLGDLRRWGFYLHSHFCSHLRRCRSGCGRL